MAKRDQYGFIIREKYPEGHKDNLGDSCAETSRAFILGDQFPAQFARFLNEGKEGYLRHPDLKDVPKYGSESFTSDQAFPYYLRKLLMRHVNGICYASPLNKGIFIKGTNKIASLPLLLTVYGYFRLLNVTNIIQGLLLKLPYRIADGGRIEKSEGQVQDYLNMIICYVFLKKLGKWATLPISEDKCILAVRKYYAEGDDFEPNSDWIIQLYIKALNK